MPAIARNSVDFPEPEGPGKRNAFSRRQRQMLCSDNAPAVGKRKINIVERDLRRCRPRPRLRRAGAAERLRLVDRRIEEFKRSTTDLKPAR